jgi:hypothetical protein
VKKGKVYFVSAPGRIKIGFTTQPEVRLAHLQAVDMERLEVIGTIDASRTDETSLHTKLEKHRIRGEWFADNEEVRTVISLFLSGELKFACKKSAAQSRNVTHSESDVSVQVAKDGLAELRRLGEEVFARALRRETTTDLLRSIEFISRNVVAPLLYPDRSSKRRALLAVEIAPEIINGE